MADLLSRQSIAAHEMEYMGEVDIAMHRSGHPWAFSLSAATLLFFLIFFLWADHAMIDDVTRGQGQITPEQGVQPIQSDKGGSIIDIHVKENDVVDVDQQLVSLSNVEVDSTLQDLLNKDVELRLTLVRLAAEEHDAELVFTQEQREKYPEPVLAQERLFQTRKQQFNSEAEQLSLQIQQRKLDVAEAKERRQSYEEKLNNLQQQEKIYKPIVGTGVSELTYLDLLQRIVAQRGELETVAQTIARNESAVRAAEERLHNLRTERLASIAEEQNKSRIELASIEQQVKAGSEHVTRTELRSPLRGTVKRILLKKDSVAKPAETIMEILPTEGALEVDARFSPADRGFLFVNQEAMVKVSAYEFSIYGGLEATVVKISQDTILDKKGEPWYEVRLLTKRNSLLYRGRELPILPGMTVTVDVLTDKKSVLSHIIGPIKRAMQRAMTEH